MNAEIKKTTDDGYGLLVEDNDDIEHKVGVCFDGEIDGHLQDAYPDDPSKRTSREDEMVAQARRYAQWYVYTETPHDTLVNHRNPDRLAALLLTVSQMGIDEIEEEFGDLYLQLRSHDDESLHPPVRLRPEVEDGQAIYKQKVYVDGGIEDFRGLSDEYAAEIGELTEEILDSLSVDDLLADSISAVTSAVRDDATERDISLPGYEIDVLSPLYYLYHRRDGPPRTVDEPESFGHDPDAILQLPELSVGSLEQFRGLLVRHLVCQIRDVYLGSGIEPPAAYRVIGPGLHKYTLKYKHFDMYPRYYDAEAEIPGYSV